MPRDRKMLRDQIKRNIKKAKKEIPSEYREGITFSGVYKIIKASYASKGGPIRGMSNDLIAFDEVMDFNGTDGRGSENENSSIESPSDL